MAPPLEAICPEGGAADGKIWSSELGMVQDVGGVNPDRERLGLADLE